MSLGWNQQEDWRCVCSCCLLPYNSCLSCASLCARCQLTKERWHSKCSGWWPSSRTRGGKISRSGFLPSTRVLKECESGILSQRTHSGCLDTQPPSSCWYCAQVLVERHFFSLNVLLLLNFKAVICCLNTLHKWLFQREVPYHKE